MTIVKREVIIIASVLFFVFFSGNDSFGQYYRYVDTAGVVHLTNDKNSESCKTYGCALVRYSSEGELTTVDQGKSNGSKKKESAAPKKEAMVPVQKDVVAAPAIPVAAPASHELTDAGSKPKEIKSLSSEEGVRNLISQWLKSWESGDMKTYKTCYVKNFSSKGMNLNAWIDYKTHVHKRSKNINISIDHMQIKAGTDRATAEFTQHYTSSRLKESGRKKLEFKKINNEWKISEESAVPQETEASASKAALPAPKEIVAAPKKEVVVTPKKAAAPDIPVAAPTGNKPNEAKVIPKESILPQKKVVAPPAKKEVAVSPKEVAATASSKLTDAGSKPKEINVIDEVQSLISQWLKSWESGDMKTYRSFYAADFQSKGMNLDAWIDYKTHVYKRGKKINISMDNMQIKAGADRATAEFTQHYTSSRLKESGRKKLEFKKINNEWKISEESAVPQETEASASKAALPAPKEIVAASKKEVVVTPKKAAAPDISVAAPTGNKPNEAKVIPKESILPQKKVVAPPAKKEVAVTPKEGAAPASSKLTDAGSKTKEIKSFSSEEEVRNLLSQWLNSWKSGDMKTYRSFYAADFQSKGMNLDAWIDYKTNVYKRGKNINISIDHMQIKTGADRATAVFTQHYTSSRLKESGEKKLEFKKISNEWKIAGEML